MPNENESQTTTSSYDELIEDNAQVNEEEVGGDAEKTEDQGQTTAEDGEDENPKQSREENARYAKMRREAEKTAKEKAEKENQELQAKREKEAYDKGRIAQIGGKNPYTDEPIEDSDDLHEYELMEQANKEGKEPIKEAMRILRLERQQAKTKLEEEAKKKQAEQESYANALSNAKNELAILQKEHPECDAEWFKEHWKEGSQFKSLVMHGYTPSEAYQFLGFKSDQQKKNGERQSTPNNMSSSGRKGRYTAKEIEAMTDEEFDAYFSKTYAP